MVNDPERNWLHWSKNRNFCKNPEKQEFQVETLFVWSMEIRTKMEGETVFLQACSTPLPEGEDEISDSDENEESDVEDYLVYDEVSQVCVICDIVLQSPSHGPLCKRCHQFMYPEYTILQKEFDDIRVKSKDKEKYIPYNRDQCPTYPKYRPRHRCGKDGTLKNEIVNKGQTSNAEQVKLPTILCFSDSESEDEDNELLGLAQLAIYDKDIIQFNATCLKDTESTIRDDFVEKMPTESTCWHSYSMTPPPPCLGMYSSIWQ